MKKNIKGELNMKKNIKILLCILVSVTIFGCSSKKEDAKDYFNKMIKAMEKNNSFEILLNANYILGDTPYTERNVTTKFNDYYDKDKRTAKLNEIIDNGFDLYMIQNKSFTYQGGQFVSKDAEIAPFTSDFEFLNVDKNLIKDIDVMTMHKKKTLRINLNLETEKNKTKYFYKFENFIFTEQVSKAYLEITLNKNYTMNNCKTSYIIETSEGLLNISSTAEFLNYGHQDIEFPN